MFVILFNSSNPVLKFIYIIYLLRRDKMEDKKLPVYEVPQVVTYTDEEILEELGPAQTIYGGLTP